MIDRSPCRWAWIVALSFMVPMPALAGPSTCTYSTYAWNVHLKRATNKQVVHKAYAALQAHEVDLVTGCTVCEEDQVEVRITGVPAFKVCRHLARDVRAALATLVDRGAPLRTVVGYRVGMTRGDADADGNRTRFSNHAFGVAIDINEEYNGLYENCIAFGPHCRLRRGGHWDPANRASLMRDGAIVKAMKAIGLKWGGEIAGQQKDFMHFSPTGY